MTALAIAALKSAHFLAHASQGDTALTNKIGEAIDQLSALLPDIERLVDYGAKLDPEAYGRIKSAFSQQPDLVPVYVIVIRDACSAELHPDDRDIDGHYQVLVPGFLSDELQSAVALDQFHGRVAIKCLDDFRIIVAKELTAPDDYENGLLEDLGDFVGLTAESLI
jgi:hypothetical protein